jgi:hypothetical protein
MQNFWTVIDSRNNGDSNPDKRAAISDFSKIIEYRLRVDPAKGLMGGTVRMLQVE